MRVADSSTAAPRFATIRQSIAGIKVAELARRFGTPLYVYDTGTILARIDELRRFDVIRYAIKACSNLAILDLIRRQGVLVEAVSAGELRRALAAGYAATSNPPPVIYTADVFDREAIELVVQQGIRVNCGSHDMIEQLGQSAPGREITLRVNPGFGHGHSLKTNTGGEQSKHGIWHEQLIDCLKLADQHGLVVTGLHVHIGSGADLEHLSQVVGAMERLVGEAGPKVTTISAGGGLPVPYREGEARVDLEAYFQLWDAGRRRMQERLGHALSLEIEPGRYIVAESGYLIAEIRAVKRSGGNTFYLLDAGFNCLARPILYGAYHPMSIAHASGTPVGAEQEVVVGGPLCESGDIFTQSEGGFVCTRRLPEAKVGDWLVIECAGAYGFVMASIYNSKPLPAEVLLRNGQAHLIRARQTFDDLVRGETLLDADR